MKLLLDENISYHVVNSISLAFPESKHITKSEAVVKLDTDIFEFAKDNAFTIVTFDEDFYELQLLRGFPPKIIWLRFGNSSNLKVTTRLLENEDKIRSFINDMEIGILEIY
jgi:predicted nuclease of predicted toxin-antitoxin system